MVLEPEAEAGGELAKRPPRSIETRKWSQPAVLRARIGAVEAGEVRRQRQRNHEEK
jgi:hypothetical protein